MKAQHLEVPLEQQALQQQQPLQQQPQQRKLQPPCRHGKLQQPLLRLLHNLMALLPYLLLRLPTGKPQEKAPLGRAQQQQLQQRQALWQHMLQQ